MTRRKPPIEVFYDVAAQADRAARAARAARAELVELSKLPDRPTWAARAAMAELAELAELAARPEWADRAARAALAALAKRVSRATWARRPSRATLFRWAERAERAERAANVIAMAERAARPQAEGVGPSSKGENLKLRAVQVASGASRFWDRLGSFLHPHAREKFHGPDLAEHRADFYEALATAESKGQQNWLTVRFTIAAAAKVLVSPLTKLAMNSVGLLC